MKKRSPAAVLLLPFVTLGIYCIYWLYATRKELVARNHDPRSIPPVVVLFLPILVFVALVACTFIFSTATNSSPSPLLAVFTIIIGMAGFLGLLALPLWWFWRYCHVVSETAHTDFTQLYVLYVVIGWVLGLIPVWMLITQLDLNKVIDQDAAAHHQPQQPQFPEHPAPQA